MSDFRIRFQTHDGILVMNRKSDVKFWTGWSGRWMTPKEAKVYLASDAREKGVKIIEVRKVDENGVDALVEWM